MITRIPLMLVIPLVLPLGACNIGGIFATSATDHNITEEPCGNLNYIGRCTGDTVEWCENEVINRKDCRSSSGKTCGWSADDDYFWCVDDNEDDSNQDTIFPDDIENSFIVSMVQDDLDSGDMDLMITGMTGLGYQLVKTDTNVSEAELIDYLGRPVALVYHTGHGEEGSVYTSDGSIHYDAITLNARNTILATCWSLKPTGWTDRFGPSAETLLGYTDVSWDVTDNDVALAFMSSLDNGASYPMAWFMANNGFSSLYDRWAIYAREESGIVEYSSRSDNQPRQAYDLVPIGIESRVEVHSGLLTDERTFSESFAVDIQIARDATPSPPYLGQPGLDTLPQTDTTKAEAVAAAEIWLQNNGGLPQDAQLDRVIAIERTLSENLGPITVGHMVVYRRVIDELNVQGNRLNHHITLLANDNGIITHSRLWPALTVMPVETYPDDLLPVADALQIAADSISMVLKNSTIVQITDVKPVWGTSPDRTSLIPAFALSSEEGLDFIIDARTGELIL